MLDKIVQRILMLLIAATIVGCSQDTKSTLSGYDLKHYVEFVCKDAKFSKEQYDRFFSDLPENDRAPIELKLRETAEECATLLPVWESVAQTHERLREGIYWPYSVYLFDLGVSANRIKTVGFFDSISSCQGTRKTLVDVGYEAGDCYERTLFWKVAWL